MIIDPQMRAATPKAEAPETKLAHWKLNIETPEFD